MIFGRARYPRVVCGLLLGAPGLALADAQQFDIPAQPLPAALKAFATQAHMQLLYVYSVVASGRGNAVNGQLDTRRALDDLLRGTGFKAAYTSESEVMIRRARTPDAEKAASAQRRGPGKDAEGTPRAGHRGAG